VFITAVKKVLWLRAMKKNSFSVEAATLVEKGVKKTKERKDNGR
jgi:hypothetical protein